MDYQKFSASTPSPLPPQPPVSGQPASGIPINSMNQFYPENQRPPIPVQPTQQQVMPWTTGLCDCFEDVPNCCITFWCPCITFGQIAEITDKGSTSCGASGALYALINILTGCACMYSCFYRTKLRRQYMLHETPCADCCVHWCCETCALCQEYRELKNRGFDMAIGWNGNMEMQNREVGMTPVFQEGMRR